MQSIHNCCVLKVVSEGNNRVIIPQFQISRYTSLKYLLNIEFYPIYKHTEIDVQYSELPSIYTVGHKKEVHTDTKSLYAIS